MDFIFEPWTWYIAGPLITFVTLLLLYYGKQFGVSSNLETICAISGAGKISSFFNFDWRESRWNLIFILGTMMFIKGFLILIISGVLIVFLIRKGVIKSYQGKQIEIEPKKKGFSRNILGGIIFGLGWGLIGGLSGVHLYHLIKNKISH